MFDIRENLKKLPDSPGVYIHKDKLGQVIYVGKAVSLKNRVRQYFQSSRNMPAKVKAMVGHIAEFEYITTDTEMEALILECTLIKRYMPKYNVLLRDDKTYPYIKITMGEDYPRIVKTRRIENDGSRYFGPYSDVGAVNQITELLNGIFCLKKCSAKKFPENTKPCLNYHIQQCRGICIGTVNREEYLRDIQQVIDFLNGKTGPLLKKLENKMLEASEMLEFEQAAQYRDYIESVKTVTEKQRVVMLGLKDLDIVLAISSEQSDYAVLFFVRDGKLIGRENYAMEGASGKAEVVSEFIKQHYSENPNIPYEILVEQELPEKELLEGFLTASAGRQVKLYVPQRGDKKDLLKLAQKDSIEMLKTIDQRESNRRERQKTISDAVGRIIAAVTGEAADLKNLQEMQGDAGKIQIKDYRIESYDISNTNGVDSVGAMVVFEGLKPNKKEYRRFKIRTIEGPNDYGSMQEVIYRRFKRAEKGDAAFSKLPDLLMIDGGKGQVSAVQQILDAMNIKTAVVGMAKDDKHRTRALVYREYGSTEYSELTLAEYPMLFKYVGAVQEEVHRFAIECHKGLRGKRVQTSVLDEIEGIGPQRRNGLLAHFGSIEKIRRASVEELCEAPGMNEKAALSVHKFFLDKDRP